MREPQANALARFARSIADWMGTPMSIVVHTVFFVVIFVLYFFGVSFDQILLILTTIVSLEAIYLSLFIQMTVNEHAESLEDVEEDIDEINESVSEISEDIEDVQEDVEVLESEIKKPGSRRAASSEGVTKHLKGISENLALLAQDIQSLRSEVHDLKKRAK
jgi:low affinity Fe/Cu permease